MTKLSELIRKAATDSGIVQGTRGFYFDDDVEDKLCLCALGAAYYLWTGELPPPVDCEEGEYGQVEEFWMHNKLRDLEGFDRDITSDVIEWNDICKLSFVEIAENLADRGM